MTDTADTMGTSTMDPDDPTPRDPLPPPVPPPPARSWWEVPVARDQDAGKIGGVVAGLCRAYGFDVTTTRIAVVLSSVVLPAVLVLYIAAWILLPARAEDAASLRDIVTDRRRLPLMIAIGLAVALGGFGTLGSWTIFGSVPWGVALIVIGVLLWMSSRSGPPAQTATASTIPPPPPGTGPTWSGSATTTTPTAPTAPFTPTAPFASSVAPTAPFTARPADAPGAPPAGPPASSAVSSPGRSRRRYPIASIAVLLSLLMVAVAGMGDAFEWWDVSVLPLVFAVLAVLIAGVVLSALVNRSWALLGVLFPLLIAAVALSVLQPNLDGGAGSREVQPTSDTGGQIDEQLAAGELRIDLTNVPAGSSTLAVDAEVGFGRLEVAVPADAVLDVATRIGMGRVVLDGDEIVAGIRQTDQRLVQPAPGSATSGDRRTIVLDLDMGAGDIEIDRLP